MTEIRDQRIYLPEEVAVLERFNRDYLPWLEKHGGELGELAVMGDEKAEMVIHRYKAFTGWLTVWALEALEQSIKDWQVSQDMKTRRVVH